MPKQEATREFIDETLQNMIGGFLSARRATAWIEWEADPNVPGRKSYLITGETREAVQAAIDARMSVVDNTPGGGMANFIGPYRHKEGFAARGEVILA